MFHHVASRKSAALHLLRLHEKVTLEPAMALEIRCEMGQGVRHLHIDARNADELKRLAVRAQRGLIESVAHRDRGQQLQPWHRVDIAFID